MLGGLNAYTPRKETWVKFFGSYISSEVFLKWQVQHPEGGLSDTGQSRHDSGISSGTREPPMNFRFVEITNGSHRGIGAPPV